MLRRRNGARPGTGRRKRLRDVVDEQANLQREMPPARIYGPDVAAGTVIVGQQAHQVSLAYGFAQEKVRLIDDAEPPDGRRAQRVAAVRVQAPGHPDLVRTAAGDP